MHSRGLYRYVYMACCCTYYFHINYFRKKIKAEEPQTKKGTVISAYVMVNLSTLPKLSTVNTNTNAPIVEPAKLEVKKAPEPAFNGKCYLIDTSPYLVVMACLKGARRPALVNKQMMKYYLIK